MIKSKKMKWTENLANTRKKGNSNKIFRRARMGFNTGMDLMDVEVQSRFMWLRIGTGWALVNTAIKCRKFIKQLSN
jgi:hypothetical protein